MRRTSEPPGKAEALVVHADRVLLPRADLHNILPRDLAPDENGLALLKIEDLARSDVLSRSSDTELSLLARTNRVDSTRIGEEEGEGEAT